MNIEITTPALLFPAISLLFLSYTNRFLTLSALIRSLHAQWCSNDGNEGSTIPAQIENLRERLILIKRMQVAGAIGLLFCVLSMLMIFFTVHFLGSAFFFCALVLMGYSLVSLIQESLISGGAMKILLDEAEDRHC